MRIEDLWVLVWMPAGVEIPPLDSNPSHEDQGLIVYRSQQAANQAADHQTELYAEDGCVASAIPLSMLGSIKVQPEESEADSARRD